MSEESKVTYHPWEKTTELEEGITLLDGADDVGISIESLCGGEGLCGTCKVIIDEGEEHLSPVTEADERVLSDSQLEDGYRLSCRCKVQNGGEIETTVPSVSQNTGGIVLTEGNEMEFELDTTVQKYPSRSTPRRCTTTSATANASSLPSKKSTTSTPTQSTI
ncbi:2Fe-2S iron-sulfur cluster-binding protein [Haloarculaceae archaeon H-GB2-1]|nr:2Fe-2S iron-sulfur cluster-binding protein [Haloarculaceae archaeon H-GB11]MEA5407242.1 2Fe-2S iron-sulfur cluster-binding protein [Haloarculaceae archaeon H-GB2-1]